MVYNNTLSVLNWLFVGLKNKQPENNDSHVKSYISPESIRTTEQEKTVIKESVNTQMEECRFNDIYDPRTTDEIRRHVENGLRGELEQEKRTRQLYGAQCRQV